ncbi:BnaAnng18370D [Brassica napus]|uniref:BnaAnng18370D protein n=1 Tax=Brassica napus TaxID=3708 RepID=A0A078JB50_BRANA|nr:BnaAnng18370D [Brassica napus]
MHDSSACQKPAPRPDVIQHGWSSCIGTHGPLGVKTMPCRALGVMLHVRLHSAETCPSRLICAISVFLVNFRPAINPEYFSAPVLIL